MAMAADTSISEESSWRRQLEEEERDFHDDILDAYRLTAPRIHVEDDQDNNAAANGDRRDMNGPNRMRNPVEMTVLGLRYAAQSGNLDDVDNKIAEMEVRRPCLDSHRLQNQCVYTHV